MLLFFSNQEAGFGISSLSHSLGSTGRYKFGARETGKGLEVRILQTHRPRTPEPSVTREPKMSRTHVGDGESGVEIFKKA